MKKQNNITKNMYLGVLSIVRHQNAIKYGIYLVCQYKTKLRKKCTLGVFDLLTYKNNKTHAKHTKFVEKDNNIPKNKYFECF